MAQRSRGYLGKAVEEAEVGEGSLEAKENWGRFRLL